MENELVDKKFGMLTVVRYIGKTSYRDHIYECICECGNVVQRNRSTLKREGVHSCGCYKNRFLTPGDSERCRKAGIIRAEKRNIDGINIDMLDNTKNISTNTSGHKGISWSKSANKWHVFIGYKSYRCNLGFVEDIEDAIQLREQAYQAIKHNSFEEFFYQLRGFRIEEKLQQIKKKKRSTL